MRLQPPDQLSVFLLWLAAIFMAARDGLEKLPPASKVSVHLDGWWSLAPLALLTIAAVRQIKGPPRGEAEGTRNALRSEVSATVEQRRQVPKAFAEALWDLVQKPHTNLQLVAFLRPHAGEWVALEAFVQGVHYVRASSHFVQVSRAPSGPSIGIEFHKAWGDHLARLSPGDPIRFNAQIVDDGRRCKLENAELV